MKRILAFIATAAFVASSAAQTPATRFPDRPVKIVVPFAPGGASDNIARVLATKMAETLKQPVVIDNKPGAAGNIALATVARSPADGYTVLLGNVSTNAINATTYAATLKMDPLKELTAVSAVANVPGVLVASSKFGPGSVAELVQHAKSHPNEVNYASAGAGSYAAIDSLLLEKAAGIKMTHVPYKGGAGPVTTALIGGEVQICFVNASSVIELVRAGRLKALAVTTPRRMPELPNVPTMAEAGFAGVGTNAWQGLFVPTGTPAPAIQKLHEAVQQALANPELLESFKKMVIVPVGSASPAEFGAFVTVEQGRWAKIVKENNVTPSD
jgi:tripartite-type tricarboxylate transporter receptor subunit TctC